MTIEGKPSPYDILDTFDEDLWVELILKSPNTIKIICLMLSLDLQIEKEYNEKQ
jgi:hypothetical protein